MTLVFVDTSIVDARAREVIAAAAGLLGVPAARLDTLSVRSVGSRRRRS